MTIDNALASLAVKDLKASVAWYEKLFRRPADSIPMPEVAEWKFERGGWLQVYQLPERAGGGSCTLAVSDIDTVDRPLRRAIIINARERDEPNIEQGTDSIHPASPDTSERTSNAKVKTVMITDPDGNHLAFAEAIDQGMAR